MDNRAFNAARDIEIIPDYACMATGSCLIATGRTKVICTASVTENVPDFLKGRGKGWLTAEYAMLPGSTTGRKAREFSKRDGRSVEIQRLIGRSLRAACDLTLLGEHTVYLDCDVIRADGGTRTASVTGAFVALCLAVDRLMKAGKIVDSPIIRQVAAVSVGVVNGECTLDLDYAKDSTAQADMNVVMTRDIRGDKGFVEVQGTGEGRPYTRGELDQLLALAEDGITDLMEIQREALGDRAYVICKKPRLVLASNNFGKLKELRTLLGDRYDVLSAREAGFTEDVEENGETFEENAVIKASAVAQACRCAALADDSGLCVDALNGRPGVHSARYSGVHGDDEANNQLLLKELENVPEPRTARYECAIALCRPGCEPIVATGATEGEILREYRGTGGFGYDPLFLSKDLGITFAQTEEAAKNKVSHRARAIARLMEQLG